MSSRIKDDAIDLQIGLLEARTPADDPVSRSSYPLPPLSPAGRFETRSFRILTLENAFLRVVVAPDLGGRILSLYDKRCRQQILPDARRLEPLAGGRRGAWLPHGIQYRLRQETRLNSLGSVAADFEETDQEDSPGITGGEEGQGETVLGETVLGEVVLGEIDPGSGLSFHVVMSLPPDRAELHLECRAFNRSLAPVDYNGGLSVHASGFKAFRLREHPSVPGTADGALVYDSTRDVGLALLADDGSFDEVLHEGEVVSLHRFSGSETLAPRQVDNWRIRIQPLFGLASPGAVLSEGAIALDGERLRIHTLTRRPDHKVLLLTSDGRSLETSVDLHPETVTELDLSGVGTPAAVVVQDPHKNEVIRWEAALASEPVQPAGAAGWTPPSVHPNAADPSMDRRTLRQIAFDPARRHAAYLAEAMQALQQDDHERAVLLLESSLLFNGDDPLAWILKAVAHRLAEDSSEDRPELPNAHFLAPLEPALRAAALLSQPPHPGREGNPLLRPLADIPDAFLDVACFLLEAGMRREASRWIDESLRHVEIAVLRYLQAAMLLDGGMQTEAAQQVAAASKLEVGPPYPWRGPELASIARLVGAFPEDAHLRKVAAMAQLQPR
jgi:hypothetical protein